MLAKYFKFRMSFESQVSKVIMILKGFPSWKWKNHNKWWGYALFFFFL